jgi:hypothetical protein
MKKITKEELDKILKEHTLWLEDKTQGKCADFSNADLRWAHLEGVNLREAHLEKANLSEAYLERANLYGVHLEGADLRGAHLEGVNLCWAHLEGANLRWAHLEGADIDFTLMALSCKGLNWKIDKRTAAQLAYHLCSMECDDEEFIAIQNFALPFANQFHRIEVDCNKLEAQKK